MRHLAVTNTATSVFVVPILSCKSLTLYTGKFCRFKFKAHFTNSVLHECEESRNIRRFNYPQTLSFLFNCKLKPTSLVFTSAYQLLGSSLLAIYLNQVLDSHNFYVLSEYFS